MFYRGPEEGTSRGIEKLGGTEHCQTTPQFIRIVSGRRKGHLLASDQGDRSVSRRQQEGERMADHEDAPASRDSEKPVKATFVKADPDNFTMEDAIRLWEALTGRTFTGDRTTGELPEQPSTDHTTES